MEGDRETYMKTSLLIMAAGIGSRYGAGIKQLATVDSANHIIMDYSIHDAIKAGFNKIVFIIRKDIESEFKEVIGYRIEEICRANNVEVAYAFQSLDELPEGKRLSAGRTKPWGTGQAVLAARGTVNEPFAVINADDYYGKEAFEKIHEFLVSEVGENRFCMAGFVLKNTLSEHGGVTRGICQVNSDGYLTDVVETKNIVKTENGAAVGGQILDVESYVSMNMWGLAPEFMETLERGFTEFFENAAKADPLKAEYLLPVLIGELLRNGELSVKVLETQDKWFGVTYQEDRELVVDSFRKLIAQGVYGKELYGDL